MTQSDALPWVGRIGALTAIVLLAACAAVAPSAKRETDPFFAFPRPLPPGDPGVALVLSGGAARGYAHIGVIGVLEAHGLRPSIIVGSSAGSIVGALYASGLSAGELERAVGELGIGQFNDWVIPGFGPLPSPMGLLRGDRLHRFIDDRVLRHQIEDFPIRYAAVATDLRTGAVQIFNAGDVGLAVHASSAAPGLIMPARIGGRLYIDGQISSPLPVEVARRLGARKVIAVDVIYPPEEAFVSDTMSVLFQSFIISIHRLKTFERAQADEVIAPELPRTTGQMAFCDRGPLIAAGARAATAALVRIEPLFKLP